MYKRQGAGCGDSDDDGGERVVNVYIELTPSDAAGSVLRADEMCQQGAAWLGRIVLSRGPLTQPLIDALLAVGASAVLAPRDAPVDGGGAQALLLDDRAFASRTTHLLALLTCGRGVVSATFDAELAGAYAVHLPSA